MSGRLYIGVSGWSYDGWKGPFYPRDLPNTRRLHYASRRFSSLEINGSFYSLLKPSTYEAWCGETPAGFRFAVKGSRFITHNKKLKDPERPLANFLASGVLALQDRLGPFVWQLPAGVRFEADRLEAFLGLLPHDMRAARALARKHDERVTGRSRIPRGDNHRLRHALEVRHPSFLVSECVRLLRRHGTALVFADSGDWPYVEELTAGFVYLRLHGSPHTYASGYGRRRLDHWARRIRSWRAGRQPRDAHTITSRKPPRRQSRDIYIYFDNDQHAHAPRDAQRLQEVLGVGPD